MRKYMLKTVLCAVMAAIWLTGCQSAEPDGAQTTQAASESEAPEQTTAVTTQPETSATTQSTTASTDEETPKEEESLKYERQGEGYAVAGIGTWTASTLEIPSEYNGLSVTAIKENAFMDNKTLVSVTIPDSVTTIGPSAFAGCTRLKNVTLSNQLLSIAEYAFTDCTALTGISLPDSLTSIGYAAFSTCTKFTSVVIPENVKSIGYCAFAGCSNLTSVSIPDGIEEIGPEVFRYCSKLVHTLYENAYYLGNEENPFVFLVQLADPNITSIKLHDGLKYIENGAFSDCTALKQVVLPEGMKLVSEGAFKSCISLEEIVLPDGLTKIAPEAFYGCRSLKGIDLPDRLIEIGNRAFYDCYSLAELSIPDSIRIFGSDVVRNCQFEPIWFDGASYLGNAENPYMILVSASENGDYLNIHEDTAVIAANAFYGSYNLNTIDFFPESVKYVNHLAFHNSVVKTIYYGGTEAQWEEISFYGDKSDPADIANIYFFSEEEPAEAGKYWHYVEAEGFDGPIEMIW